MKPATISQSELDRRIGMARAALAGMAPGAARQQRAIAFDAMLMPWLAIAIRAGADPEQGAAVLEDYRRAGLADAAARACAADDICPAEDCRAELARARDVAIARALAAHRAGQGSPALDLRALPLTTLSIFIGCPAVGREALEQRKAA